MIMNFEPVPIIETAKYGLLSAVKAYEAFKITSMNDADKLAKAKDDVYNDGFYTGVIALGQFKNLKVQDAKPLIKAKLIDEGEAVTYFEPDGKCISRSGDECIVAFCDQWYINYGQPEIRDKLKNYVNSKIFETYNENVKNSFI